MISSAHVWLWFTDIISSIRLFYGVLVGFLFAAVVAGFTIGAIRRAAASRSIKKIL